jgi:hypothetical protein
VASGIAKNYQFAKGAMLGSAASMMLGSQLLHND